MWGKVLLKQPRAHKAPKEEKLLILPGIHAHILDLCDLQDKETICSEAAVRYDREVVLGDGDAEKCYRI